jgi:hypothetical protein
VASTALPAAAVPTAATSAAVAVLAPAVLCVVAGDTNCFAFNRQDQIKDLQAMMDALNSTTSLSTHTQTATTKLPSNLTSTSTSTVLASSSSSSSSNNNSKKKLADLHADANEDTHWFSRTNEVSG